MQITKCLLGGVKSTIREPNFANLTHTRMLIQRLQNWRLDNPSLPTCVKTIQNSVYSFVLDCFYTQDRFGFFIPAWYINKFTIIDFTIYTWFFLVKLKIVVDGPILHSKCIVDRPIQYGYIIEAAISY